MGVVIAVVPVVIMKKAVYVNDHNFCNVHSCIEFRWHFPDQLVTHVMSAQDRTMMHLL